MSEKKLTDIQAFLQDFPEEADLFAEEDLIVATTEMICKSMEEKDISRSDLAGRLGKSKAYVSQVLSGSRNLTLRTLAQIAVALDMSPEIHLLSKDQGDNWTRIHEIYLPQRHQSIHRLPSVAANDMWTEPVGLSDTRMQGARMQ